VSFEKFKDPHYPTVKGGIISLMISGIFITLLFNQLCQLGGDGGSIIDT